MHLPTRHRGFRALFVLLACLVMAALGGPSAARAADFGAKTNGSWNSSTTWTPNGGPPGVNDVAYIGSNFPGGAAPTATVMLTQNQQAFTVLLGYGAGTSGTLNLGNFNLNAVELYLGVNGGTGAITRGTGSFDVGGLVLSRSTLVMSANDRAGDLILRDGSSVTTVAVENLNGRHGVGSGSTLTLGADLVAGFLFVEGANSTLDAQGHTITAGGTLSIGWGFVNGFLVPGSHVVQFLNRGDLHVGDLLVANQNLNLTPADQVNLFALSNGSTNLGAAVGVQSLQLSNGATATTTAVGNITFGASVGSGSTLTLGADLDVTVFPAGGFVSVGGNNSTLDAQSHKITATGLSIGWDGGANARLLNRGDVAVTQLFVANQNFNLTPTDQVNDFFLSNTSTTFVPGVAVQNLYLENGASATTSTTGNITHSVDVTNGSTLTLGADLSVSGIVQVYGDNSTLNAQGHKIAADQLRIGVDGGTNVRLLNKGELAITGELVVANLNLNLSAGDQVANFRLFDASTNLGAAARIESLYLQGASATTAAPENLTGSVDVIVGSTLTLGANLDVGSNVINVSTSTLNAQGHGITAGTLSLGMNGGANVQLLNDGAITVGTWFQGNGIQVELHDGNDTVQSLNLAHDSDLRIKSAATGFTISGTTADDLQFNGISTLTLELNGLQPGWVLRWANPDGGNHIADLNALIAQNFIAFNVTDGGMFEILSLDGYTYVFQPVPEPAAFLLPAALMGFGLLRRRRHRPAAPVAS